MQKGIRKIGGYLFCMTLLLLCSGCMLNENYGGAYPAAVGNEVLFSTSSSSTERVSTSCVSDGAVAIAELGAGSPHAEWVEQFARRMKPVRFVPVACGNFFHLRYLVNINEIRGVLAPNFQYGLRTPLDFRESARRDLQVARALAAANGADRLLLFDLHYAEREEANILAITYWLFLPIFFVPGMTTEYTGDCHGAVIDVRSGNVLRSSTTSNSSSLIHFLFQGPPWSSGREILLKKLTTSTAKQLRPI